MVFALACLCTLYLSEPMCALTLVVYYFLVILAQNAEIVLSVNRSVTLTCSTVFIFAEISHTNTFCVLVDCVKLGCLVLFAIVDAVISVQTEKLTGALVFVLTIR